MLMPSIMNDNFFDDFMDGFRFPTLTRGYENMPQYLMRTDVRETENTYELDIDLPGYSKEDVKAQLKDGYLTVSASKSENKDEKDEEDKYLRRERYSGSVSRRYYVGENLTEDDIHAKFENGILKLSFPKDQPKKVEAQKFISIE